MIFRLQTRRDWVLGVRVLKLDNIQLEVRLISLYFIQTSLIKTVVYCQIKAKSELLHQA